MIGDLRPYAEYKDSGLPWLGPVPGHWDVKRPKQIGYILKGIGGTKEDSRSTGIPCVRYGELYTTHHYFIRRPKAFIETNRASAYTPIRHGDVLFAASGEKLDEIGKSAVNLIEGDAVCGGDTIVLRPRIEVYPPYLGYAFDCRPSVIQKASMGRGTTVKHIYPDELKQLQIPLPPPSEQAAIVRFLDWANGRLERAIRAKRKVIALLNEQKQSIIHRAVTRGLDPSVALKASGVPWLGEIPAHWEVVRSRRLFSLRKELARTGDVQLSATQAFGVIPQDEFERRVGRRVVKISMHLDKRKHVERDDFVMSMRSFQGGLERAWADGAIRSSYVVLKPSESVQVDFFTYVLKSREYVGALQCTADFIRDGQDLTEANFRKVDLPLPPKAEQSSISLFIQNATSRLIQDASRLEREIDLLREYRTRLVADVVTGKLDVREAATRLPEEELLPDLALAAADEEPDDLAIDEEDDA